MFVQGATATLWRGWRDAVQGRGSLDRDIMGIFGGYNGCLGSCWTSSGIFLQSMFMSQSSHFSLNMLHQLVVSNLSNSYVHPSKFNDDASWCWMTHIVRGGQLDSSPRVRCHTASLLEVLFGNADWKGNFSRIWRVSAGNGGKWWD